jgi:TPR repeat protein
MAAPLNNFSNYEFQENYEYTGKEEKAKGLFSSAKTRIHLLQNYGTGEGKLRDQFAIAAKEVGKDVVLSQKEQKHSFIVKINDTAFKIDKASFMSRLNVGEKTIKEMTDQGEIAAASFNLLIREKLNPLIEKEISGHLKTLGRLVSNRNKNPEAIAKYLNEKIPINQLDKVVMRSEEKEQLFQFAYNNNRLGGRVLFEFGKLYEENQMDLEKVTARGYYAAAASQGLPAAQLKMGDLFYQDGHTKIDNKDVIDPRKINQAIECYEKVAQDEKASKEEKAKAHLGLGDSNHALPKDGNPIHNSTEIIGHYKEALRCESQQRVAYEKLRDYYHQVSISFKNANNTPKKNQYALLANAAASLAEEAPKKK